MNIFNKAKHILIVIIILFLYSNLNAQTTVFEDPLNGGTSYGSAIGGTFTTEGYKPGTGSGHILYKLPYQVPNGYMEFEMKGFTSSAIQDAEKDADNGIFGMYDGRGISEPIQYFDDFKTNFFRWNFHYRQNRSAYKCVLQCAAPTSSRLNATKAVFGYNSSGLIAKDWGEEPTGINYSTNSTSWYKVRVEWKDKHFFVSINGTVVWEAHGPYDYAPIDHRIWVGSAPGVGDKYTNSVPNVTYRNVKVVTYGKSTTPTNNLSVTPSSQNVSSVAGSEDFAVSSNVSWTASDNASWLTLSPSSGSNNGNITASFAENTSTSSRTATITVTGDNITRTVTLTQAGTSTSSNSLTLSPNSDAVNSDAGNSNFTVSSNVSWTASDNVSWLTLSPSSGSNNGTITASFTENTSTSSRTATVTVTGGGIIRTATVTQSGKTNSGGSSYITVPTTVNIPKGSGTIDIQVESNISWSVKDNTGAVGGWISKSPKNGTGNGTVTMTYKENTSTSSRTGNLIFTGGGLTKIINVVQAGTITTGNTLSLTPNSDAVNSNAGSTNFVVTSNVSWTASNNVSWLTLSPSSGSNNGTIAASFTENTSTSSRTASITVTGGGLTRYASITQSGKATTGGGNYINVPATVNIPKGSGTVDIQVESNISWSVKDNTGAVGGWISKSPKNGTGNGTVTMTYKENTSTSSRTGNLIFTGGGLTKIINVVQAGSSTGDGGSNENYISVPETIDISSKNGTFNINVKSNVEWSVKDNTGIVGGWLSKTPKSGSGDGTVIVRYLENTTGSSRTGNLIFTGGGVTSIVTVNQSSNNVLPKAGEGWDNAEVEAIDEIPTEYSVVNYPNPFNPSTTIQYALPFGGFTELTIYNSLGQIVRKLVSEFKSEGTHNISFNASDLSSGIYFYTLRSGKFVVTNKMILVE